MGDYYTPGASDPRHIRGSMGEELLAKHLRERNFIVFKDFRKSVIAGGIDLTAYDRTAGELWHIDNKAQESGISDATSLTKNYVKNAKEVEQYLRDFHPNRAEAELALRAIGDPSKVKRVIANALAGETTRFTSGCFAKGLDVYDIRFARRFTSADIAQWRNLHLGFAGRKGVRAIGVRGAATVEASVLVVAVMVGAGTLYAWRTGGDVKNYVGAAIADLALGSALARTPGGWLAALLLSLESDEAEGQRLARKRQEAIDDILSTMLPLTPAEEQESRLVLGQLMADPLSLPQPPPDTLPSPVLPSPAPAPPITLPPLGPPPSR